MDWTDERPTEPGEYWYRLRPGAKERVVTISPTRGQWKGPITSGPPTEPEPEPEPEPIPEPEPTPEPEPIPADVTVTVERSSVLTTSKLALGVVHMQESLVNGAAHDQAAVESAKSLLRQAASIGRQPVHGGGSVSPWSNENYRDGRNSPSQWDWGALDRRVQMMADCGHEINITLWSLPGFMKSPPGSTYTEWESADWSMEIAWDDSQEDNAVELIRQCAIRYNGVERPEMKWCTVWAELKGLFTASRTYNTDPNKGGSTTISNEFNYVRYTRFYNKAYRALKAVRPTIKVGGPYIRIEGSGTTEYLGRPAAWYTATPLTARDKRFLNYWLQYKAGADFLAVDRNVLRLANEPDSSLTTAERFTLMPLYRKASEELQDPAILARAEPELPIVWEEDYVFQNDATTGFDISEDEQAALIASMLMQELLGGASVSMRWEPQRQSGAKLRHNLFSSTRADRQAAEPFHAYRIHTVYKAFKDHFGAGVAVHPVTVSAPGIAALASPTHTLLINEDDATKTVDVEGQRVTVAPYEVKVVADAE